MKKRKKKSRFIVFMTSAIIILLARTLDDIYITPLPIRYPIKFAESSPAAVVPEPVHIREPEPEPAESVVEPAPVKNECTIAALSKENVECWNKLFGARLHFEAIISYEIVRVGNESDDDIEGVLFTAVGRRTVLSPETMIVPEGYYEQNRAMAGLLRTGMKYPAGVMYGFIAVDAGPGKFELKLFGRTNMFECAADHARERSFADIEGVGRLCAESAPDDFPVLETQRLLSDKNVQIRLRFRPGAYALGIYDYLFLYEKKKLSTVFSAWHAKSGAAKFGEYLSLPKVQYEKDRIVEYSSLHTPFEGRGHEWTFTARSVFAWDGQKFVLKEEQILPLQREMVDDYRIEKEAVAKIQHLLGKQEEGWRFDPLEVAMRNCDGCRNFKMAFLKQGVAVVWAERAARGSARAEPVSVYLYGPFYTHEGIANAILWSVMESEKRIPGRLQLW